MRKHFCVLIVFIAFIACTYGQETEIVKTGQIVPVFSYTTADGKLHQSSELKGKVVLINFFATWCGPCRAELPQLQEKVWDKYGKNDNFVMLVIGREHTSAEINTFKEKYGFKMPMMGDPGRTIYKLFATQTIPRNYIINPKGKITYLSNGYSLEEFNNMLGVLNELLR